LLTLNVPFRIDKSTSMGACTPGCGPLHYSNVMLGALEFSLHWLLDSVQLLFFKM